MSGLIILLCWLAPGVIGFMLIYLDVKWDITGDIDRGSGTGPVELLTLIMSCILPVVNVFIAATYVVLVLRNLFHTCLKNIN